MTRSIKQIGGNQSALVKNVLLILFFTILSNMIWGQSEYSTHKIEFYKNTKESSFKVLKICLILDGIKYEGQKNGSFYQFPIINSQSTFELAIETNRMNFHTGPYESSILNNGSDIILGKITCISKLMSVAEYNEMDESDNDYDILKKRFFIANDNYTIDIDNYENIKQLDYLIINPNQEGDGSYVLIQKIVKLKNRNGIQH